MTQYASKSILKIIAKDVLGNFLEYGDEVFGVAFGEKQLDTGGIEPDAYLGTLFSDWDEAVLSMGLPADTETYRRYLLVRHLKLFGLKRDKEGFAVTAEKRIPPPPDTRGESGDRFCGDQGHGAGQTWGSAVESRRQHGAAPCAE